MACNCGQTACVCQGTFASPESVRRLYIVSPDPLGEMLALLRQFKPPPTLTDGDVSSACIAAHKMGKKDGAAAATRAIVADLRAREIRHRAGWDDTGRMFRTKESMATHDRAAWECELLADRYERGEHLKGGE